MSELESKTIMVSLVFTNEVVEVSGEDYKGKCKLIQVLLEDNSNVEKIEISVNFNSEYFRRFVMNDELERTELNVPFSLNLEPGPFIEFVGYSDIIFESMFIQLGYFGADDAIILLRNIVKKIIRYRYIDHKSVERFFLRNIDHLENIWQNPNISDEFVRANATFRRCDESDFQMISKNESISVDYLYEKASIINYRSISRRNLPIWFIDKYAGRLHWIDICEFSDLGEDYINSLPEHRKIWKSLAANQYLSESFIEANIANGNIILDTDINYLLKNKGLSEKFFLKYVDSLKFCRNFCAHPNLTADFYTNIINNHFQVSLNWDSLCCHPSLPQSFFEQHKQLISGSNIFRLAKNPNVSLDFIKKTFKTDIINSSQFKFHLYQNPQMDEKNIKQLISEEKDKNVCWNGLIMNSSISEVFISKHKYLFGESEFKNVVHNTFRFNHKINYKAHRLGQYL